MLFISQKRIGECGICVTNFILKNYKNEQISIKIYTKNIPISTISKLLSCNLVENKLKYAKKWYAFEHIDFPQIIHCKGLLFNHYIVLLKKIGDYYLVYNSCLSDFKYMHENQIAKSFSGYFIEIYNVDSLNLPNKKQISYLFITILRFFVTDLLIILFLLFLFYWKNKKILVKYYWKVGVFYGNKITLSELLSKKNQKL